MSVPCYRRIRRCGLAAATVAVLSSSLFALPAVAGRVDLAGIAAADFHTQFIVKYRQGSPERRSASALRRSLETVAITGGAGQLLNLRRVRHLAVGAEVIRVDRPLDRVQTMMLMRQLAADPSVEYVEIDRMLTHMLNPDDPRYPEQWSYQDPDAGIRANEAWDSASGAGVVVAILDTGITNHSELNGNVIAGYDFVSDAAAARDGDGRDPDPADEGDWYGFFECGQFFGADSSWHGTHVAGTVAASTNNGVGVAGVAFDASIQPVRVLAKCGGSISDISDAIVWASGGNVPGTPANANPAEVINLSLGGGGACPATLQSAINGAVSRGVTLAIAAGNANADTSGSTPANCDNVIAVASIDSSGQRSSFSNYGSLIDIAAPGSGILSTLNDGATTPGNESYAIYSGTSMAAPHVAGVIALLQSAAAMPKTPAEVETLLGDTARAFPATPDQPIGPGILDAKAVVDAVGGGGGGNNAPTAGFSYNANGLTVDFNDSSSDSDGSIASRSWDFGDGGNSTATNPSHTYASGGSYTVALTVTDNDGASDSQSQTVTVSDGGAAQTYSNNADYQIRSRRTVESRSACPAAPATRRAMPRSMWSSTTATAATCASTWSRRTAAPTGSRTAAVPTAPIT